MTKNKTFWTKILAAVILAAAFFSVSCNAEKKLYSEIELTLSSTEVELSEGENILLKVTVTPVSAEKKTVEWRVSDPSVAAVEGGLITGLKSGETIVTAYTGEKTACCKVKVKGSRFFRGRHRKRTGRRGKAPVKESRGKPPAFLCKVYNPAG